MTRGRKSDRSLMRGNLWKLKLKKLVILTMRTLKTRKKDCKEPRLMRVNITRSMNWRKDKEDSILPSSLVWRKDTEILCSKTMSLKKRRKNLTLMSKKVSCRDKKHYHQWMILECGKFELKKAVRDKQLWVWWIKASILRREVNICQFFQ